MTQQPNDAWQEFISTWQKNQNLATDSMMKSFEQWNKVSQTYTNTSSNPLLDMYSGLADSLLKNASPFFESYIQNDWNDYFNTLSGGGELAGEIKKAIKSGEELFQHFSSSFDSSFNNNESHEFLMKSLMEISNPSTWLKYSGDNFDLGAHKLSEGTVFSGINDIDKRFAKASDSWIEFIEESKKYHSIVFTKWTSTYTDFINEINALEKEKRSELTPRELIEMWTNRANSELLELHRSTEFLNAQRAVINTSMQYRLNEKKIAERICEALHIPTRDEVDDLHKTVTELRRELRQFKTQINDTNTKPKKQQPVQLPSKKIIKKSSKVKKEPNP